MTIHLTFNTLCGIAMLVVAYLASLYFKRNRSTAISATMHAWTAWKAVSERAIAASMPVPPIPTEHAPKR